MQDNKNVSTYLTSLRRGTAVLTGVSRPLLLCLPMIALMTLTIWPTVGSAEPHNVETVVQEVFDALEPQEPLGEAIEETLSTDEEGAHKKAGLPQFDISTFPSQIFWLFVSFGILYVAFSTRILPGISVIMEKRRDAIHTNLSNAKTLKEEAESIQQEYEAALESAREQSKDIFKSMHDDLRAKAAKSLEEFNHNADKRLKETEAALEKNKKTAMKDIEDIAAEIASDAAQKLVGIDTSIAQAKKVISQKSKAA